MLSRRCRLGMVALGMSVATLAPAGAVAASSGQTATGACVKVTIVTRPHLNTAMIDETIVSTFHNCSTKTETVLAVLHLSGPTKRLGDATAGPVSHVTLQIGPHQTKSSTRIFPYTCCGTYTATVTASVNGHQRGQASDTFTFA